MKNISYKGGGTALVITLLVAAVLLQLVSIYLMQVQSARPQSEIIDERIRLRYLAQGLSEIAILKFQKYPFDFYNVWKYKQEVDSGPYDKFVSNAAEFMPADYFNTNDQPMSFNNENRVSLKLKSLTLATSSDSHWGVEVLEIITHAEYVSKGHKVSTRYTRKVKTDRALLGNVPDP